VLVEAAAREMVSSSQGETEEGMDFQGRKVGVR
jgi:hypothetical protein